MPPKATGSYSKDKSGDHQMVRIGAILPRGRSLGSTNHMVEHAQLAVRRRLDHAQGCGSHNYLRKAAM